jgi:hypothetical protein
MAPRTPRSTPRKFDDSFKFKFGETTHVYSVEVMLEMIVQGFKQLQADGITHVAACNLYIPLRDEKGGPITRILGKKLEDRHLAHPYRSAADEHGV